MTIEEQIQQNQTTIKNLAESIKLLLNTPNAQIPEIRATVNRLHDNTIKRLRALEIEGQRVKIENMEKAAAILRDGVPTT